ALSRKPRPGRRDRRGNAVGDNSADVAGEEAAARGQPQAPHEGPGFDWAVGPGSAVAGEGMKHFPGAVASRDEWIGGTQCVTRRCVMEDTRAPEHQDSHLQTPWPVRGDEF